MNKTGALYFIELKKILHRRMVWIACAVTLVLCAGISLSNLLRVSYITDDGEEISGYEMMKMNREYARDLSGRAIDNILLSEMQEAEGRADKYVAVYSYVQKTTGDSKEALTADEAALYSARRNNLTRIWREQMLTEEEITYWLGKEKEIETPFIFAYADGWADVFDNIYALNFMLLLLIAVCLSNVFSMEHIRRTDQLLLCTRCGRKNLYYAKILAGITFGMIFAVLLFSVSAITSILIYGSDGFHAALQVVLPLSSRPVSVGKAVMTLFVLFIIVSILYSIVTMFLSEWLKNSAAVMGVLAGGMVFTMLVDIPYWLKIPSQLYDLLPTTLLIKGQLWDGRLLSVLGKQLTNYQSAAIAYTVMSVLLAAAGGKLYQKYQVNAR